MALLGLCRARGECNRASRRTGTKGQLTKYQQTLTLRESSVAA
jgi:hypothetical protein